MGTETGKWSLSDAVIERAPSKDPLSLAVFRVVVSAFALQLGWFVLRSEPWTLPPELWSPPFGTAWAVGVIPVGPVVSPTLVQVFLVATGLLMLGVGSRVAGPVAALLGLYVGWMPGLSGKVNHYHHLMWFLVLLALAPCADRLALGRRRVTRPPIGYAVPTYAAVLVIGFIYLGAGIRKLASAGFEWAFSDNLQSVIYNISWQKGLGPPAWVTDFPLLVQLLAFGALVFELGFLALVVRPETRRWARWAGPVFHMATWALLGIGFWSLQACFVVFFDWSRWDRVGGQAPTATGFRPGGRIATGGVVGAIAVASLIGPVAGWPLAAYPGFEGIAEPRYSDVEILTEGGSFYLSSSAIGSRFGPEVVPQMLSAALAAGPEEVEAFVVLASDLQGEPVVGLDLVTVSTDPDRPGELERIPLWRP